MNAYKDSSFAEWAYPSAFGVPSGGSTIAEITSVQTLADASGSLHGKYFTIYDGVGPVGVYIDLGALPEIVEYTAVDGFDYYTGGGAGVYIALNLSVSSRVAFWFNYENNASTEPTVSGVSAYYPVSVDGGMTSSDVAAALVAVASSTGFTASSSGSVATITSDDGDVTDFELGGVGSAVTTQQGRNTATAPGTTYRNIQVSAADNNTADQIATALASAVDADGSFSASASTNTVTITASPPGSRPDAADVDTGFTITVTQQGG